MAFLVLQVGIVETDAASEQSDTKIGALHLLITAEILHYPSVSFQIEITH